MTDQGVPFAWARRTDIPLRFGAHMLCRSRLKTPALTRRLLARYVPLRLKPSESVLRQSICAPKRRGISVRRAHVKREHPDLS